MIKTLLFLAKSGRATPAGMFPELPAYSRGLPMVTSEKCAVGDGCRACFESCPTEAISFTLPDTGAASIAIDLGKCVACGACVEGCPTNTIVADRRTDVAVLRREDLIVTASSAVGSVGGSLSDTVPRRPPRPFRRSLHVRVVSTGDSATDLEVSAAENPIFDAARFGIQTVASPRFADALVVTGPVAHAMREPLLRCYDAMAAPRIVVAVGASAISGGLYRGGYAAANGVNAVLPVDAYVPGNPPHPWSILHGLLLAMGHSFVRER